MLELTFQEQERKINDAAFAKYKPELVRLMNECVRNEDFEQAKHIRDILERKSLPGIQEEEKRITRISSGNGKKRREDTSI